MSYDHLREALSLTEMKIDYEGAGSKKVEQEVKRIIKGAGKVVHAQMYEPAKGGGFVVVLDTEYAALKVYYKYRHSTVHLDKNPKGWVVSVK